MPRRGRLHIEGGCYHVMGRGLERRDIFGDDDDKADFIRRLSVGLELTEMDCLAWAMMSNHYHLLLRVRSHPLSDLMRRVLSGYASAYNRRHRRAGYVFQNRFKSILCDEEQYLLQLVRYIHLNPVKAGIIAKIDDLDRYRWTGHAVLMGFNQAEWQHTDDVLARFGKEPRSARKSYKAFICEDSDSVMEELNGGGLIRSYGGWEALKHYRREHETKIGDERILGDSDFVLRVIAADEIGVSPGAEPKLDAVEIDELVKQVCNAFDVPESQLTKRGRQNNLSKAKAVICYFGLERLGIASFDIAKRLDLSRSGASDAAKRGKTICETHNLSLHHIIDKTN